MNNMNEIIAKMRKDAGLTQEQLANMIGVSTQTVSKWETGTTMPDIMLLPIIADVFNIDIDSLFGRTTKKAIRNISKDNVHEELYNAFFETLQYLWDSFNADVDEDVAGRAREMREAIKHHSRTQTLVLSNIEGNGVYADSDIALAFNKNKDDINKLFDDETAWTVLKRFADGETRTVYKFIVNNRGKSFTSSFIATKCDIDLAIVERALNNLLCMNLISRRDVNTDDGVIYVYSEWGTHKLVLIYSILSLASRLGNYIESYRGFLA